jgi:hypothetical protein
MSHLKFYCLKCKAPNSGCKCKNTDYHFSYSHKLRVPNNLKNKVIFREFLDNCCIFVNCVPENLKPAFRDLLRYVKYYDKVINGRTCLLVQKGQKMETDLF